MYGTGTCSTTTTAYLCSTSTGLQYNLQMERPSLLPHSLIDGRAHTLIDSFCRSNSPFLYWNSVCTRAKSRVFAKSFFFRPELKLGYGIYACAVANRVPPSGFIYFLRPFALWCGGMYTCQVDEEGAVVRLSVAPPAGSVAGGFANKAVRWYAESTATSWHSSVARQSGNGVPLAAGN